MARPYAAPATSLRSARAAIRAATFAPRWLPGRWRHPLIGYAGSALAVLGSVLITALLIASLPGYTFYTALSLFTVLVVAITWGAGPAMVAALLSSCASLYFTVVVHSLSFTWGVLGIAEVAGLLVGLAVGLTIGLVTSRARAAVHRFQVLQAISDAALAHLSSRDLLRALLVCLTDVLSVDNAAILIPTADGKQLVVHMVRDPEEKIVGHLLVPIEQGIAGQIATTRAPLIVDDLRAVAAANPFLTQGTRSLMGVPLLVQDRLVGVVHVGTRTPRHFTGEDLLLLRLVGDRMGLALDHARLHQEEQRLRREAADHAGELEAVFEAIADGIFVFDHLGALVHGNGAGKELLHISDMPDFYAHSLEARDERQRLMPSLEWPLSRALGGEVLTGARAVDLSVRTASGESIALSVSAAPIRDQQGQITGAACMVRDVTEHRRLEEQVLAQRNRLQQILDVLPEGIMIADAQPPVVAAMNGAAAEFLGIDVVGQPVPIPPPGVHGEYAARRMDGSAYPVEDLPLERALLRGEVVRGDQLLLRNAADGRETTILANSAPIRDSEGRISGAVLLFQDITALRDLDRRRESFLVTVSHDLKNPLTSILGLSQLLQRRLQHVAEPERERFNSSLLAIAATVRQMSSQISELLDLTRLQLGQQLQAELSSTDVIALLAQVIDAHQLTTDRHILRLEHELDVLEILADAPRLGRAVTNLLGNAIKYCPHGGEISIQVTLSRRGDATWLAIEVRDQGIGIPKAEVGRIFEHFYRASNVVDRFAGTGLGLTGVRQIVQLHGGTVTVESTEGLGTSVTILLPLRQPQSGENIDPASFESGFPGGKT